MATYIYNMITKRLILILLLLIPSLLSYSKQGPPQFLRLEVNVFEIEIIYRWCYKNASFFYKEIDFNPLNILYPIYTWRSRECMR